MNTPAHAIFNLLVLGRRHREPLLVPIAVGAVVPDLPMVWFYFQEKVLRGTSESIIWGEAYFRSSWQAVFDLFNSLPLIGVALTLALLAKRPWLAMLFVSMGVHCLCDLPLHNDDAHRHFYPFSNWRFESPISYWDPRHSGLWVAAAETAMVLFGSVFLGLRYRMKWVRVLVGLVLASAVAYIAYVLLVWV